MEIYVQAESLPVLYVKADSFPQGIMPAFDKLKSLIDDNGDRQLFGISRPENGVIQYKAGTLESFPGEGEELGCEIFMIPAGNYLTEAVADWRNNVPAISKAFDKLLQNPQLDPGGYCIERYTGTDVFCMVKLKD